MPPEESNSPFQRNVAFTGRLASMNREEAFALVRRKGGSPRRGVTKQTSVLVVGELGWPLLPDGRPAKSLALARSHGVAIASERQFLEWAGKAVPEAQVRAYSASRLAALSGLPLDVVEELIASGAALSTITRSLHEIRKWLPDAALSKLRLYPAASDRILVEQLKGRTDQTGQFILPVGESRESADQLFEQAQAAEEAEDFETAQRLYRKVMRIDPADPAAAFNLGNLFRSSGRKVEAEAAYRAATKADPGFAEAWYNLADLLDDQRRADKAVACLERALAADPHYADAIFNLGLLHQRNQRLRDAADYWRRYLALDNASSWAVRAKRALKYCEMQIAHSS
jgi:tetratricopeptide (TPR) repeat protein